MNTTSKENRCISIFFLKKLSPFPLKLTKGSKNKRKNCTFTATKIGHRTVLEKSIKFGWINKS